MKSSAKTRSRFAFKSGIVGKGTALTGKELVDIDRALGETRERMGAQFTPTQVLGRRDPIGCVALEITQRCNLDCTLCYLSDNSEDVKDIPIEEVYRRLDGIKDHYGAGTVVQITGGDPTLRKRQELVDIVRYTRSLGLQPALFTNGILASRALLIDLVNVGLVDIAFHVDLTQEREGYDSEKALNAIRSEYIDRARGLPLTVIFNTTIFAGNFNEIPDLIRFFRANTDVVRFASFQLQADTGRGELTSRHQVISVETVREQISKGADMDLDWDPVMIGHPKCHSYVPTFAINGNLYNVVDGESFLAEAMEEFKDIYCDRRNGVIPNALPYLKAALWKPKWIPRVLGYLLRRGWKARKDIIAARGQILRLSFFIHNFMDASALDEERIEACSFMVMTHDGPVSMCEHNAKRDEYILTPLKIRSADGEERIWEPLKERKRVRRKARGERDWKESPAASLAEEPFEKSLAEGGGAK